MIDRKGWALARDMMAVALFAAGLAACSSSGGAPGGRQAATPRVIVDPLALFYVGMDMDDDLIVTRAEFQDRAPIQFVRADTNGDNHLRPIELSAWVEEAIGTRDAPYGMGSFDRVPDGKVTEDEFLGFLRLRFNMLDQNGDGELARSEIARVVNPAEVSRQQGGQNGGPPAASQRRRR
ncbi:MAG: hypothetical protein AAFR65_05340 [Pseudomonadota bacterium]